jgi:hypothetical protein
MKETLICIVVLILQTGFIGLEGQVIQYSKGSDYTEVYARRRITGSDGKVSYREYEPFKTRTIELLNAYWKPESEIKLSRYGGRTDKKLKATGFFRVEKRGNRWWCVDPEGNLFVNIALNSISQGGSERNKTALEGKFGSQDKWIGETLKMLKENGFNCAGSWSDHKAIISENARSTTPFAYTVNLNFMSSYGKQRGGTFQQPGHTGYPNDAIFVFDTGWVNFCDRHARQAVQYRDDPNFFGYFSDNEMPFKLKSLDNYLSLPEGDPGRIASEKWLSEKNITKGEINDSMRADFLYLVAEKYFSTVSKALKKYDPNHMYLGSRFYSSEKNIEKFMRSAGRFLDIVSINYYNKWTPDSAEMARWVKWTGRPFIITEYYTKGEDSGMQNKSGAGWIVRTQRDRGLFYQNYNLALLQCPECVGWHYFKYQDNDPTAKGVDPSNTDSNKGVVNNEYEVWEDFMNLIGELNRQAYSLIDYFDGK